jgi:transposase InsO family protein
MKVHANAALGPAGRLALVEAVESGMSLRAAAAALNVSPATAHRWWHRRRAASLEQLASGAWLCDRSSRPRRQPRRLSEAEERPILRARAQTGLGPGRLAGIVRRARSTIWKVLRRNGASRRRREPRPATRRYEWSRPGALIHVDTAQLPAFRSPGHRVRGRSTQSRRGRPALGCVYLHVAVDDHTRYAYVEQRPDQRRETVVAFMRRALAHFDELGLGPPEAVMSDNGNPYRSRLFGELLAEVGARQILTPPYTPRWNGKVERLHQTMDREWARGQLYRNSTARNRALKHWLRHYNHRRPHSSLGGRPPITRALNL